MTESEWKLIKYFKPKEFKCNCGRCDKDGTQMDFEFVTKLDMIRHMVERPIVVTSGLRCLWYQEQVNPGVLGAHPLGRAADVMFKDNEEFLILCAAIHRVNYVAENVLGTLGIQGLGIYPTENFIHMDNVQKDEEVTYDDGQVKKFHRPAMWGR